jgi:hypothetical protein
MTPNWFAWLLMAIYLAVGSIQAIAAPGEAIACQAETAAGPQQTSSHHSEALAMPEQGTKTPTSHTSEEDAADADNGGHLCCQLDVVALPSQAGFAESSPLPFLPSPPDVSRYVAFLERFERPPLA